MPAHSLWYKDAVFYEVAPRAMKDGNGDGIGDFIGLTQSLDYLADLGVTCLWLLPMYPSPLRDDGYDIADYCGIHPSLGTLDDFKAFMAAAKARGLRVIADLVLNHTSDQHPWFQAAREGPGNPYYDYYVWSDTPDKYAGARIIFTDSETSNWSWDARCQRYYWHRFYASQPDLNYDNPAVCAAMLAVFRFWMDLGLDGFRVDAVPYLFEREGTSCENLPETHAFLKRLRAFTDEHYPEAILLGEANQWPEDVLPYFGDEASGLEFHMSFHFPLMPRMFQALRRESRASLSWILGRTPAIPPAAQWATFLRNHDELTLEMVTDEERAFMYAAYAPDARMRLNVGIRRRLWPLLDHDRRQVELLHGLLFALPGSPVLYYGDELGMGDNVMLPDRYGVRTPMQWNDQRNAGASTALPSRLQWPVIADPGPYHYQAVNVAAAQADKSSFYHWLKALIALRKGVKAFGHGDVRYLAPANEAIFAFLRRHAGEVVLVVANLSGRAQGVELALGGPADGAGGAGAEGGGGFTGVTPVELLGGAAFPVVGAAPYPLTLAPYGFYWLRLAGG